MAGLPCCDFRYSTATSIDVQLQDNGPWYGLVSVGGVSVDELIRHCKDAFLDGSWKHRFLVELPRLLMWSGSTSTRSKGDGTCFFSESQSIVMELEDSTTGEINEQKVTCSATNLALALEHRAVAVHALEAQRLYDGVPRVGLDAPAESGDAEGHGDDDDDDDDNDEGAGEDADDGDDDNDADAKAGFGANASPPKELIRMHLQQQLQSIVQLAGLAGVPPATVREAFVAAGGEIVEPSPADAAQPMHMGGMPPGMMPGMPPGMGAQPAECRQQ